jgi:quercetin dioxygenase-like cupin family protein
MQPTNIRAALRGISELAVTPAMTQDDAQMAMRELGSLNESMLGLVRFSGQTPWERHPGGDELLHVLEGAVDVTVLTDDRVVDATVGAGSLFIVPRGLWHRQKPHGAVTLLFATPAQGTEHSWAEDPRS